MLDITTLRKDLDAVIARLETRKTPQVFLNVDVFKALEAERKTLQTRTEELQSQRNTLSKQIGQLKAKDESADAVMVSVGEIKVELEASAARLEVIQSELQSLLLAPMVGPTLQVGDAELSVISTVSPLGRALLGLEAGDTTEVRGQEVTLHTVA